MSRVDEKRTTTMGIFDFVKSGVQRMTIARPDPANEAVVYKHLDQNFSFWTQLTVDTDEVALFFTDGRDVGTLSPGRHTLDPLNFPFLGALLDKVIGGNVFISELYFVTTRALYNQAFGGPIDSIVQTKIDARTAKIGLGRVEAEVRAEHLRAQQVFAKRAQYMNQFDMQRYRQFAAAEASMGLGRGLAQGEGGAATLAGAGAAMASGMAMGAGFSYGYPPAYPPRYPVPPGYGLALHPPQGYPPGAYLPGYPLRSLPFTREHRGQAQDQTGAAAAAPAATEPTAMPAPTLDCAQSGAVNASTARFCSNCGQPQQR